MGAAGLVSLLLGGLASLRASAFVGTQTYLLADRSVITALLNQRTYRIASVARCRPSTRPPAAPSRGRCFAGAAGRDAYGGEGRCPCRSCPATADQPSPYRPTSTTIRNWTLNTDAHEKSTRSRRTRQKNSEIVHWVK